MNACFASCASGASPSAPLTDVDLVVANPAYAADELEPSFNRSRYHGTVIWSWQQALLAAGIERQLGSGNSTCPPRATGLQCAEFASGAGPWVTRASLLS